MRVIYGSSALCLTLLAAAIPASAEPPKALDIEDPIRQARLRARVAEQFRNPAPVEFAPGPESALAPHFMLVRDTDLELPVPPWSTDAAYAEAFELARIAWYRSQPDRIKALLVFSTFDDGGNNLFYLPLANDVEGLGEGEGALIFDDTPDLRLDGAIWMGSVAALEEAGDAYFREAFMHEIAHRWCSYSVLNHGRVARGDLLGRQASHWSFFVDSGLSPMDGNDWEFGATTARTSIPNPPVFEFSPLDLYLMGVLPADNVPSFSVITSFTGSSQANLEPSTPPARRTGSPVSLIDVQVARVGIADIISASGARVPAPSVATMTWPVGIVLLSDGFSTPKLSELARLDARIVYLAESFRQATDGRIELDINVLGAGTLPPGAACLSLANCDRTRSDACEPPAPGADRVCTRRCASVASCSSGECCRAAFSDNPIDVCVSQRHCQGPPPPPPPSGVDAGPTNPGQQPPELLKTTEPVGCTCTAPAPQEAPLVLLWCGLLLLLGRATRAR